jgi:PEGA domain-containing protein
LQVKNDRLKEDRMERPKSFLVSTLLPCVVGVIAAFPHAAAGKDKRSWENLKSLAPGQAIEVEGMDSKTLRGTFLALSDESLTLRVGTAETTVGRGYIWQLVDRTHSRRGHQAAIGALIGGGIGAFLGALTAMTEEGTAGAGALEATIFTGLGAGLGSLSHGYPTLYKTKRRSGSALAVESTPAEADLAVDGKREGKTPYLTWLSSGTHTVTVEKPGYKTWQGTLTASPGTLTKFSPVLEKAD